MRPLVNAGGVVVGSATAEDLAKISSLALDNDQQAKSSENELGPSSVDKNDVDVGNNDPSNCVSQGLNEVATSVTRQGTSSNIENVDSEAAKKPNNVETVPSVGSVMLDMAGPEMNETLFGRSDLDCKKESGASDNSQNTISIDSKCESEDIPVSEENRETSSKDDNLTVAMGSQDGERSSSEHNDLVVKDVADSEENAEAVNKNVSEGESLEMPVMVSQASQTDLEECVEDSDGLRFLSIPQKPAVTAPVTVSKPAPVVNKSVPMTRTSVAPPRVGVRMTTVTPSVRPQPTVRPAYAAVSRASSLASTKTPHLGPVAPRPYTSPRLVRSRTSTDVRPAGRGTTLRKLTTDSASSVLKPQRPAALARQVGNVTESRVLSRSVNIT